MVSVMLSSMVISIVTVASITVSTDIFMVQSRISRISIFYV